MYHTHTRLCGSAGVCSVGSLGHHVRPREEKNMWNWIYVWSMANFQLHLTLHRLPKARETHSHTHKEERGLYTCSRMCIFLLLDVRRAGKLSRSLDTGTLRKIWSKNKTLPEVKSPFSCNNFQGKKKQSKRGYE